MASPYRLKDDRHSSHAVILRSLGAGGGRRALDVGAADGFLASRLALAGWRVTALEGDAALAARARAAGLEVIEADLDGGVLALPGPFDAIVCGDVLEHLRDPLGALRALLRALAPGGLMVVSVPNVAHLWVRLSLLLGRFDYADRGILDRTHLRFFTRRTLLALLEEAGLAVDGLAATPVPLPLVVPERLHGRWLSALHGLGAAAARGWPRGLGYQFVAVCRARGGAAVAPAGADRRRASGTGR